MVQDWSPSVSQPRAIPTACIQSSSMFYSKRTPPKKGGLGPLERRVKQNPRYATVGSVINSGTTVHKVRNVSTTEFLKRRSELFRRVSGSMLRELFDEYEPAGHEDAMHLTPRKMGDGIGSLTASPALAPRVPDVAQSHQAGCHRRSPKSQRARQGGYPASPQEPACR